MFCGLRVSPFGATSSVVCNPGCGAASSMCVCTSCLIFVSFVPRAHPGGWHFQLPDVSRVHLVVATEDVSRAHLVVAAEDVSRVHLVVATEDVSRVHLVVATEDVSRAHLVVATEDCESPPMVVA